MNRRTSLPRLDECPRCGECHEWLKCFEFKGSQPQILIHAPGLWAGCGAQHWAMCPTNGEPILIVGIEGLVHHG